MPCNSDHLEPSLRETESKLVAAHLVYFHENCNQKVPSLISNAAEACYGDTSLLDEMTANLCQLCGALSEEDAVTIIYNARCAKSRRLADWWEKHQEADAKRKEEESAAAKKSKLRDEARSKLTEEELAALLG